MRRQRRRVANLGVAKLLQASWETCGGGKGRVQLEGGRYIMSMKLRWAQGTMRHTGTSHPHTRKRLYLPLWSAFRSNASTSLPFDFPLSNPLPSSCSVVHVAALAPIILLSSPHRFRVLRSPLKLLLSNERFGIARVTLTSPSVMTLGLWFIALPSVTPLWVAGTLVFVSLLPLLQ